MHRLVGKGIQHLRQWSYRKQSMILAYSNILSQGTVQRKVYFSSTSDTDQNEPKVQIVDEFYDEEREKELEFLDLASAVRSTGVGLDKIAMQKAADALTWKEVEEGMKSLLLNVKIT